MKQLHLYNQEACFYVGDFNDIMYGKEKKGGNVKPDIFMKAFRDATRECGVDGLCLKGNAFTWNNRRPGGENIACRLDRALASKKWKCLYPFYSVLHLPWIKSDHSP